MSKYTVTVSYECEADSEISAIFALNKSLRVLSENELQKFEAIRVEEKSE
jgi:hypothetical protein